MVNTSKNLNFWKNLQILKGWFSVKIQYSRLSFYYWVLVAGNWLGLCLMRVGNRWYGWGNDDIGEKGYGWGARKLQILIGVADMDCDGG